jgi:hypothetical protein
VRLGSNIGPGVGEGVGRIDLNAVGPGDGAIVETEKSVTVALAIAALPLAAAAVAIVPSREPSLIELARAELTESVRSTADETLSSAAVGMLIEKVMDETEERLRSSPARLRTRRMTPTVSAHSVSLNCDVRYPSVVARPLINAASALASYSLQSRP